MDRVRRARIAAGAMAMAAVLGISSALPAQAAASPRWHIVHRFAPRNSYAAYTSVAVSGPHAWAVGGYGVAGYGLPTTAYWNRGHWSAASVPQATIGAVIAVSADAPGDAWAVSPGDVLHWHGGRWTIARTWDLSSGPPGPNKTGITALSPTNVWVFGGTAGVFTGNGTWHLHGRTWTKITGPGSDISAASADSASDMWAIGGLAANSILHYTRGAWRYVPSAALKGLQFGSIFASSATSVWVTASAGGTTGIRLLHLHGGHWTAYKLPWSLPLLRTYTGVAVGSSISPDGQHGFWISATNATGRSNWLVHFSSTGHWSRVRLGADLVSGIARVPGGTALWAVGSIPQGRSPSYTDAVIWAR